MAKNTKQYIPGSPAIGDHWDELCDVCGYRKGRHEGHGAGPYLCLDDWGAGTRLGTQWTPSSLWAPGYGSWRLKNRGAKQISAYPHKCPGCGKPAYCGAAPADVDCSANCRPQYTKSKAA